MRSELSPALVAARLAWLRSACVPMTVEEARRALSTPPPTETFEQAVARRLRVLRALMELTARLRGTASSGGG